MIVIGIDPSKNNCGIAIFEYNHPDISLIYANTLNIGTQKGLQQLTELLKDRQGAMLFFEFNPFNRGSQAKEAEADYSKQDALGQRIRRGQSETVGMILGICSIFNIHPHNKKITDARIAAMTAKKALTGTGKATKEMMIASVGLRFDKEPVDEHSADAIAVGLAGIKRIADNFPGTIKQQKARKLKLSSNKVKKLR